MIHSKSVQKLFVLISRTFREEGDPLEFYLQLLIQLPTATFYLTMFSAYSSCFIGLCIYLGALMDEFKSVCSKLDRQIIDDKMSRVNCVIGQEILADLVQLHSNTLRLVKTILSKCFEHSMKIIRLSTA